MSSDASGAEVIVVDQGQRQRHAQRDNHVPIPNRDDVDLRAGGNDDEGGQRRAARNREGMQFPDTTLVDRFDAYHDDPLEHTEAFCFLCARSFQDGSVTHESRNTMSACVNGMMNEVGSRRLSTLVDMIHEVYTLGIRPHMTPANGYNGDEAEPDWTKNSIRAHLSVHDTSKPIRIINNNIQIMLQILHTYDRRKMVRRTDDATGETSTVLDDRVVNQMLRISNHVNNLIKSRIRCARGGRMS